MTSSGAWSRSPPAYLIDYADGTRATMLMLNGAVADYTFAARLRGSSRLVSTQFLLPPIPNVAYSACLMHKVEEMIETGRAPYPVERTMLVSGMLESCLDSKIRGSRRSRHASSRRSLSTARDVAILPDLNALRHRPASTNGSRGVFRFDTRKRRPRLPVKPSPNPNTARWGRVALGGAATSADSGRPGDGKRSCRFFKE